MLGVECTFMLHIMNTSASYNGDSGVQLSMLHNTLVSNTVSLSNSWHGLSIDTLKLFTCLQGKNGIDGMFLKLSIHTTITTTVVMNNFLSGIDLESMKNTWLTNITAINNTGSGILTLAVENAHIINTTASGNRYGIK